MTNEITRKTTITIDKTGESISWGEFCAANRNDPVWLRQVKADLELGGAHYEGRDSAYSISLAPAGRVR